MINKAIMQKATKKNCFSWNERATLCDLQNANGAYFSKPRAKSWRSIHNRPTLYQLICIKSKGVLIRW